MNGAFPAGGSRPEEHSPPVNVQTSPLLTVRDLRVAFESASGGPPGLAVDGLDFSLARGQTLCLVGESGCGKSVTALSLPRLLPSPPARQLGGSILFDGLELGALPDQEMRRLRGSRIGMIFQDPMTSLNPVMRIGEQMAEPLRLHRGASRAEAMEAVRAMLERVGLADARRRLRDFPHLMSGGMRQRVMIGMALICGPDLLIADEPTTALDVTVQRQILRLMRGLVNEQNKALLLITHDFDVVARVADHVAVMYAGRIVEQGPARQLLAAPAHPYTEGLLRSRPGKKGKEARLFAIPGVVPGLWSRPEGCAFHPRCSRAFAPCARQTPPAVPVGDGFCRCWAVAP